MNHVYDQNSVQTAGLVLLNSIHSTSNLLTMVLLSSTMDGFDTPAGHGINFNMLLPFALKECERVWDLKWILPDFWQKICI